ncbi:hypothetical protein SpCBS45565_g06853 [Spizellomyces sp. 'palustris']|nr:hypothetical protein SpCBS45565_g06853 [Spizellomyces sp. 'palustris']
MVLNPNIPPMFKDAYDKRKDSIALSDPETEYRCLVRAVGGSTKISTLVNPQDTDRFHDAYTNIIRLHMDSLKKKERTKKVKKPKGAVAMDS